MGDCNREKRRAFLRDARMFALALASGAIPTVRTAGSAEFNVRIASNAALENATLNKLIKAKGFLDTVGVSATIVNSRGVAGPLEALLAGDADICLVSGYNGIIPAIEKGAALKVVAGAMLLPAHAVYTRRDAIKSLADLIDKDVGVGDPNGLLHTLIVQRLRKAGIDPDSIRWHDKGSNTEVYASVAAGDVDAGVASVANLESAGRDGVKVVAGGRLWQELKEYTFQTAYATDRAICTKREALVRTLAAFSMLYRFLHSPESRHDFFTARRTAQDAFDMASAESTWRFIQENRPFAVDLVLSKHRLTYLQELNISMGTQQRLLPYSHVADMSLAREAVGLVNSRRR